MFASAANVSPAAHSFFDYRKFGARQHIENLHPYNQRNSDGQRNGVVSFAQRVHGREKQWQEWTVPTGGDAILEADRLSRQDNREDIYVSQATFTKWRSISQIATIGACFVDLDYHNSLRWKGREATDVASAVLVHLDDLMIPAPSYILSTGRGLVCVWLTELLPRGALPRWNAVQKSLLGALEHFGADRRALDAARVFRLCGTENSRSQGDQRVVRLLWCQGSPEVPTRHVFSTLADEVLPLTQEELRAKRATRRLEVKDRTAPAIAHSAASYWECVLTDLQTLRAHRYSDCALTEGQRDSWLFIASVAISWISPPEVLGREITALANEAAGWHESESRSRMAAVIKRARLAASGKKLMFGGIEVDCRYRMKASTIVEWLHIDPAEQRAAGLRVLVDSTRRQELSVERMEESRRRHGVKSRKDQQAARIGMGQAALYLQGKDAMSRDELATHFGVSAGQISKAMAEARLLRPPPGS